MVPANPPSYRVGAARRRPVPAADSVPADRAAGPGRATRPRPMHRRACAARPRRASCRPHALPRARSGWLAEHCAERSAAHRPRAVRCRNRNRAPHRPRRPPDTPWAQPCANVQRACRRAPGRSRPPVRRWRRARRARSRRPHRVEPPPGPRWTHVTAALIPAAARGISEYYPSAGYSAAHDPPWPPLIRWRASTA